MPRIRQLYPLAYLTNSAINGDFEQIIRYLNAAELGNKTLAELLRVLFDEQGELSAPIEMRLDPEYGLQDSSPSHRGGQSKSVFFCST